MQRRQPRISTSRRRPTRGDAVSNLTGECPKMRAKLAQRGQVSLEHILIARHCTPPIGKHPGDSQHTTTAVVSPHRCALRMLAISARAGCMDNIAVSCLLNRRRAN
ncbi:hypothetical protein MA4S0726RB_2845 [Mycobacteroides abscessus 4S-0726-RB]|nr:hypothetical protein MA4S0303_3322 [Mycobacteroides abscessus 4S-0303]EIT91516.1 hypothetical protein MA4S0726RB_2845 [Mycobacteroides abscessus 4S-0726-RB]EIT95066.1 hypothetical protein MA4S0726RA_3256 [Mycobacteroides abscessus 4S-0726-RA]EIV10182.1 hypothetical protein MA4S0206_3339 [Mycobacteroides abscessus 4S-0206]EIV47676.1 hypothetical protein MA4S0116R_3296 [Mycobacteroides abscessus 4S-0116-R]EIV59499.1 hypothetical protein MA4S0116S_2394 [Mycobacteroides abscessus 4S-0116-S]